MRPFTVVILDLLPRNDNIPKIIKQAGCIPMADCTARPG
jgi:hypothetical protein